MDNERLVVFEARGLGYQLSEVYWPKDLPLPKEPNLPRGSRAIEMPNGVHKGIALGPINELYCCIEGRQDGYNWQWKLADDMK